MNKDMSPDSGASGSPARRASALALTLVIAVSVATGWVVFEKLVFSHQQPSWDEAAHALQGALIAHDLRGGHLLAFLFDSYRQVYWPPLHSWLVAASFLVAGPSLEAARAVSVLSFVLLAPTLFLVARTIGPRDGIVAGSLAAAFALTSPGLIGLAASAMLELPGLLALSCTMLIYCALERDAGARPRAHLLLGMSVVITYLIKANYGVLLVITIVLARLFAVRFRVRLLLTKQNLYAILPLALFCAVWFAYPRKVVWTWNALLNTPWGGEEARGLAGLLFFPRALADLSGSWWLAAILWAGLVLAWGSRHRPGVPFLALLALTLFGIGELHHTKIPRHILPMFPPMFVLTGVAGARLWAWLRSLGKGGMAATVVGLACIALFQISVLQSRDWKPESDTQVAEVLDYVSAQAREGTPALVVGTHHGQPMPPVLDWNLVSTSVLSVTNAGSAMNFFWERRLRREVRHARVPELLRVSIQHVLGRYYAPSPTRSLHAYDRGPASEAGFRNLLTTTLEKDPPRTIIAITENSTNYAIDDIASEIATSGLRETSVREFPRAGTRVYVYRRP
jgi:4-amino-4-deoxy-L-arabinose transferase-like glycosyltransferase